MCALRLDRCKYHITRSSLPHSRTIEQDNDINEQPSIAATQTKRLLTQKRIFIVRFFHFTIIVLFITSPATTRLRRVQFNSLVERRKRTAHTISSSFVFHVRQTPAAHLPLLRVRPRSERYSFVSGVYCVRMWTRAHAHAC